MMDGAARDGRDRAVSASHRARAENGECEVNENENTNEATALTTPGQISGFMWLRMMHMLALDLNTGMGHSGGPILRQMYRAGMIDAELRGTKANKRMVLAAMIETMREANPEYVPSASMTRALSGEGK